MWELCLGSPVGAVGSPVAYSGLQWLRAAVACRRFGVVACGRCVPYLVSLEEDLGGSIPSQLDQFDAPGASGALGLGCNGFLCGTLGLPSAQIQWYHCLVVLPLWIWGSVGL